MIRRKLVYDNDAPCFSDLEDTRSYYDFISEHNSDMDNDIREKIVRSGYDYVKPFHDMLILLSNLDDEFEEHGSFDIVDCGGDPLGTIDELLVSGLVSLARDGRTRHCEIYRIKK